MLQQTQVPRVIPRYLEFLQMFPTPAACATAPRGDVIRLWGDLGFARRAVNLHAAAVLIVERHGGQVPRDVAALRALPGIGGYTARAVLAFAWDDEAAPVDTNIGRVLARAVAGERLTPTRAQDLADGLVPRGRSRDWSLALMDLGAQVCAKSAPRCSDCPLLATCVWAVAGWPDPDPARGSAGVSRAQSPFA
ncbi:MAG TPA: A/G-specific adenine glycosylase, partial [Solirubrobacteraceae bacterium]|nr:A/G-specific adenine glycosylase [Solirubrobacteraceae bacterium]